MLLIELSCFVQYYLSLHVVSCVLVCVSVLLMMLSSSVAMILYIKKICQFNAYQVYNIAVVCRQSHGYQGLCLG
jgi:hypothetical protein